MKKILLFYFVLFMTLTAYSQSIEDVKIEVVKLGDRVKLFKVGDNPSSPNVSAIETNRGLVIIDTFISYQVAQKIRKIIEGEFRRKDFAYVINTHHHFDHSNGNQVFSEATIIGQENAVKAMDDFIKGKDQFIQSRRAFTSQLKNELESLDPGSDRAKQLKDIIWYNNLLEQELNGGFILTPPEITFSEAMTLHLDNITLELYYAGKAHTDNDIFIYLPEEGTVWVGDTFFPGSLFISSNGSKENLEKFISVLDNIFSRETGVKQVVGGHNLIPVEYLKEMHRYIKELYSGVQSAKSEGLDIETVITNLSLDNKFTWIKHIDLNSNGNKSFHEQNIKNLYGLN